MKKIISAGRYDLFDKEGKAKPVEYKGSIDLPPNFFAGVLSYTSEAEDKGAVVCLLAEGWIRHGGINAISRTDELIGVGNGMEHVTRDDWDQALRYISSRRDSRSSMLFENMLKENVHSPGIYGEIINRAIRSGNSRVLTVCYRAKGFRGLARKDRHNLIFKIMSGDEAYEDGGHLFFEMLDKLSRNPFMRLSSSGRIRILNILMGSGQWAIVDRFLKKNRIWNIDFQKIKVIAESLRRDIEYMERMTFPVDLNKKEALTRVDFNCKMVRGIEAAGRVGVVAGIVLVIIL